jgi:hypothetical protein
MSPPPPWYADWTFWAFVTAAIGILLSQLPPIHQMLRRGRLRVDLPNQINVAHWIGYPSTALYLSIANTGERAVNVESISLKLSRDGADLVELPTQVYFEKPTDTVPYLFSPFSIEGRKRWRAYVRFFSLLPRQDDLELRRAISVLKQDIVAKRAGLPRDHADVPGDPEHVAPFTRLFEQKFIWMPGTYHALLSLRTEPASAAPSLSFSFSLFESETAQLRAHANDYQFGVGPILEKPEHWNLMIRIERQT